MKHLFSQGENWVRNIELDKKNEFVYNSYNAPNGKVQEYGLSNDQVEEIVKKTSQKMAEIFEEQLKK